MKLTLLGTAAAEGWPAPFCECRACERARHLGGKDIRSRSGALVDGTLKIDFSADTLMQAQRQGLSLAGLRSLVVTHDHSDHFIPEELRWLGPPFSTTRPSCQPLELWANERVLTRLLRDFADYPPNRSRLDPCVLEPGREVLARSGHRILGLPADHCPDALLLRVIAPGGGVLFYGHDSGSWPEPVFAALRQGPPIDLVLLDCTNGGAPSDDRGHMGVAGAGRMVARLRDEGLLARGARCAATHFSHNGGLCHAELEAALAPHGLLAAHDGMELKTR